MSLIVAAILLASLPAETHIVLVHSRSEMNALAHLETRREFRVLPGAVVDLSPAQVETLRADPRVRVVLEDYEIARLDTTQEDAPWNLDRLDQGDAALDETYRYGRTGEGVRAYVVDTGIRSTHQELAGRVEAGVSFVDDGNGTEDCSGHGTHVAGTIGGATYGVAKEVTLVPVRIYTCDNATTGVRVFRAIDWIIENAVAPAVVNMSFGGPASEPADELYKSLSRARPELTIVVSAGNDDTDACGHTPARIPEFITVGATNEDDHRAGFSNYGPCVDLFAPGVDVLSAGIATDHSTKTSDGTSMSAPHVAGVATVLLEEYPDAVGAEIRDRLLALAVNDGVGSAGPGSTEALLQSPPQPEDPSPADEPKTSAGCSVAVETANASTCFLALFALASAAILKRWLEGSEA